VIRGQRENSRRHGEIDDGGDEHRPAADAIGDVSPEIGAGDRADARGEQDVARLERGELPRLDDEDDDEADEVVVEEFQRIADGGGSDDLVLVPRQPRLLVEILEHRFLPDGVAASSYLIASGLTGDATAPVIGSAGATNMNS
jgi:hypothetical protein